MKKARSSSEAKHFLAIPNIGKAMVKDFELLGLKEPADLKRHDGIELYKKLMRLTKSYHDPCVADTFLAAVDFMKGGSPKKWWEFTAERKKRLAAENFDRTAWR